jgi:putative transposase
MSPLYSRKTPRAQRYNYSSEGFYFVTICTKNRVDYFGEIIDKKMILSDNGKICNEEIKKLQKRNTVDIHERIVMPNHVHILIEIKKYPCRDCRDALMGRPIDDPIGRPIGDHYQ